jgi:glycosyltransferase involved in cell wall biosynthesis
MKISIVTISFNQGAFLEEAIASVLNQRGVDLEYIIVDPGSTDNSREIIKKYESRIHKIVFEKDKGPGDGLNKGFAHATGDILGFLNADDVLYPGALAEALDYFKKNPDLDVLSGHGYVIDETGKKVHKLFSNKLSSSRFSKQRYAIGYSIVVQPSTFFKKEIFIKTGGFDNSYRIMWDGALVVDFMNLKAKFKVAPKFWSGFRIYSNSITGSLTDNDNRAMEVYKNMQKRAGLNALPGWKYAYIRYAGWLLEPSLLIKRLIDGLTNPKRSNVEIPRPKS